MPKAEYGTQTITFSFSQQDDLKSHYITVNRLIGVQLKGPYLSEAEQVKLILKKALWIIDKQKLVEAVEYGELVTGSRVQYLGKHYYVQIICDENLPKINIEFTASKFKVSTPIHLNTQENLQTAFEEFFHKKAESKLPNRVEKWSKNTGLTYSGIKVKKLEKRWGSCTPKNVINLNTDAIKLPYSLIDYLIVHELVHTKIKNHSKEFWREVSVHIPNYLELDEKMAGMKL